MFGMSRTVKIAAAGLGTALLLALGACGEPAEEETQGSVTPTEQAPADVAQDEGSEEQPAQQ